MKRTAFSLLALLWCLAVYAQNSLTGTVFDTENQPVDFATVAVYALPDSALVTGAVTATDGTFRIASLHAGKYLLTVSHLLYQKQQVVIDMGTTDVVHPPIVVSTNDVLLKEVVITGDAVQRRVDGFRVSLKDNPITKGRTGTQVLSLLPGVIENSGSLMIEGRPVARIYINNRRVENQKELAAIPADMIERVDIIPMANSSEDAALNGGIIRITLKQHVDGGYYGSVTGEYSGLVDVGTAGDGLNAIFNGKWGKLNLYNYAAYGDKRAYDTYTTLSDYKQTGARIQTEESSDGWSHTFTDQLSLVYELNQRHSIGANLMAHLSNSNPHSVSSSVVTEANRTATHNSRMEIENRNRLHQYQATLNYSWLLNAKGSNIKLTADYLRYNSTNDRDYTNHSPAAEERSFNNTDSRSQFVEADAKSEWVVGKASRLDAGANYRWLETKQQLDYSAVALNDRYRMTGRTYSAYVNYQSAWKQQWMYQIGVRAQEDRIGYRSEQAHASSENVYRNLFPTVMVMYRMNPEKGHSLRLSYQKTMNRIPYSAITPVVTYENDYFYTKGNVDLTPNTYHSLMANLSLFNRWNISLQGVYSKNIMFFKTFADADNPMVLYTMPVNGGRSRLAAVSVDRTFQMAKWWSMKVNANIGWQDDRFEEQLTGDWRMLYVLNHTFSFSPTFGASMSMVLEPTFKKNDRIYQEVYSVQIGAYKYTLKNRLLLALDGMLLARNRTVVTQTNEILNAHKRTTPVSWGTLRVVYYFNGGKRLQVKRANSIQYYQEVKDDR
ncbi:MAG: TonB-dependent receptor [Prevotellaceae bacterium]|jgi:hypothetical protein|nr:TonB-dependent receptor [Prevotellaceae bacterium]